MKRVFATMKRLSQNWRKSHLGFFNFPQEEYFVTKPLKNYNFINNILLFLYTFVFSVRCCSSELLSVLNSLINNVCKLKLIKIFFLVYGKIKFFFGKISWLWCCHLQRLGQVFSWAFMNFVDSCLIFQMGGSSHLWKWFPIILHFYTRINRYHFPIWSWHFIMRKGINTQIAEIMFFPPPFSKAYNADFWNFKIFLHSRGNFVLPCW